jgi:hypothetical protein
MVVLGVILIHGITINAIQKGYVGFPYINSSPNMGKAGFHPYLPITFRNNDLVVSAFFAVG